MIRFLMILIVLPLCCMASKYELSVCAIFQDDAPYLREWIEFHRLQGVKHFYLYNNLSQDNYAHVLKKYIRKGQVTLTQWPYAHDPGRGNDWSIIQCNAYNDCLKCFGEQSQWIVFIDTDEFLFSPAGQLLTDYLKPFQKYGGVAVNWWMFGTSGIKDIPSKELMIELLTSCSSRNYSTNIHVKSIVQPTYVVDCKNPHHFEYQPGFYAVETDETRIDGPFSSSIKLEELRINHYWARTERYLHECKIPRRNHMYGDGADGILKQVDEMNLQKDTSILQFAPQLRQRMGF